MGAGATLSSEEQTQKLAVRRAIAAAGGQIDCALETRAGRSQLQRCASANDTDSLTLRDAHTIDSIGAHVDGHPFIARTMARLQGYGLHVLPEARAGSGHWWDHCGALTMEAGEIVAKIGKGMADGGLCARDVNASGLRADAQQLLEIAATLLAELDAVGEGI
jgi:hypothetical protein